MGDPETVRHGLGQPAVIAGVERQAHAGQRQGAGQTARHHGEAVRGSVSGEPDIGQHQPLGGDGVLGRIVPVFNHRLRGQHVDPRRAAQRGREGELGHHLVVAHSTQLGLAFPNLLAQFVADPPGLVRADIRAETPAHVLVQQIAIGDAIQGEPGALHVDRMQGHAPARG